MWMILWTISLLTCTESTRTVKLTLYRHADSNHRSISVGTADLQKRVTLVLLFYSLPLDCAQNHFIPSLIARSLQSAVQLFALTLQNRNEISEQ